MNKQDIARKNILKKSIEISGKSVKGYDFNKGVNFNELLKSFETTGAQATNLAKAIEIIKKMKNEKAFIYLGYTSNMVTTGIREIIRYLTEHKLINYLVTTTGGIEEDIIKCLGDFKIGRFNADGSDLRDKGINRAGNIFIPNSRYCKFEDFVDTRSSYDLIFTSIPYYDLEIYSNNTSYKSFDDWKATFIKSIESYGGKNCYINSPEDLGLKLGWTTIDSYISSNRSHFDDRDGQKKEIIAKL